MIFKSADERGWGLKCLRAIKYGEPVLEYVGEIISMREFHKRETEQEATGTLYCLELPQEDETEDTYCIDSGFIGNHARFVNHSVSHITGTSGHIFGFVVESSVHISSLVWEKNITAHLKLFL